MDLALVGLVLPGIENLSLDVLRHAARKAGFESQVVPWLGFRDLPGTVAQVLSLRPRVVGLSIQTSESILPAMALVALLRRGGYRGQIVCGGHFATLHAEDILALDCGVDFVVRLAGERALVAILQGEPDLASIPGLVYRDATSRSSFGGPADAGDVAPRAGRAFAEHLGFAAADLVASRGCEHHCGYCCVAGASDLARAEGRRGGRVETGYERRSLDGLIDELASLSRAGVRVVTFMDDNFLPDEPAKVTALVRALVRGVESRGERMPAFALQMRADAIDEESATALAEAGLTRAYVGIDGYSESQLRVLGRASRADSGARATRLLHERGVYCVANALVIGPTVSLESIEREAEGIAGVAHAPVHLLPIEVRKGSTLFDRATKHGLVEGGFLLRTYRFVDPRVERVARVLLALPTRLAQRSLPVAMYDLGYNLGIARVLAPELDRSAATATWERLTHAWNADQAAVLGRAIAAAKLGDAATDQVVREETARVGPLDRTWIEECDRTLRALVREVARTGRRSARAHTRSRLMGAVAFGMSLAACSEPAGGPTMDAAAFDAGQDATDDAASGDSASTVDAGTCADGTPVYPTPPFDDGSGPTLSDPCAFGEPDVIAHVDADGHITSFAIETDGGTAPPPAELLACLEEMFAGYCYPSAAGGVLHLRAHSWIA